MSKVVRMAENVLRETGLPFEIIPAKKHHKIVLAGRCVSHISRGVVRDQGRQWANFRATILRAAKEIRDEDHNSHL